MTGQAYDWTKFKKMIFIDAPPEKVYQAWAQPAEIVKWFIAEAEYRTAEGELRRENECVQAGDRYYWRWHQDLSMKGEFSAAEENRYLAFTFGEKENGTGEMIRVSVRVTQAEDGRTALELLQDNMADALASYSGWHMSCNLGWSFFMTNLKAYLEHGIDLREYDPDKAYQARAISLV